MNKKHLVLSAVLVVAAAVVAAVQLWPSTLKDLRAQNLCLGMLTEQTAGLLSDGKGGRVSVDEHKAGKSGADPVFSTTCFVIRVPEKATEGPLQYTLAVRPADTLNSPAKGAATLPGSRSGWVGPRQSEVQLPAGCPKKMKADTEYATVTLEVAPGVVVAGNWDDAALAAASRTVILEAVDNLAKQYDCEA
ncbi:hypothetical protein [Streptomyces sp. NBC_00503]|uniref:hypothetical protein n=1 Tax=Streptomyces sp. NBC_00503 TaxID=2903659 RepID=UPI002E812A91|nr:hypothetical protein [Streptomyces sp. NBC_00503]WUD85436.1 hypothetical protein OG490_35470 [Streptomyces sp. NBC_00503]